MKNIKETRLLNQPEPRIGQKSLSKIEGILTSSIQLKQLKNKAYYLAFFQLEGLEQDIPVVFKLDSSVDPSEQTPPAIPLRTKLLLEGH